MKAVSSVQASLERRLAEIHRGIQAATEQQYLAGLEVSANRWSSLTTPILEPQVPLPYSCWTLNRRWLQKSPAILMSSHNSSRTTFQSLILHCQSPCIAATDAYQGKPSSFLLRYLTFHHTSLYKNASHASTPRPPSPIFFHNSEFTIVR